MDRQQVRASILAGLEIDFARSGGPGGQNVNKVNSKAIVRIAIDRIAGLGAAEALRLRSQLASRITAAAEIIVTADEERDQARNRDRATERLVELVIGAATVPTPRKKTRPGRAARERRLQSKRARAASKRLRGPEGRGEPD